MNVLIAGGYGFIGSFVGERFYREGYRVYIIDNLSTGNKENVDFPHKFYRINIQDEKCIEIFRSVRFDIVIHLAASNGGDASVKGQHEDTETNILGLVNMLHIAKQFEVRKLIYASSADVYGADADVPFSEEAECLPKTPYGINKQFGEFYCEYWRKHYGLETVCLRISNVYGPRQMASEKEGVCSDYIQRILTNNKLVVYGDGEQTRDFIYVEDVADAIFRIAISDCTGIYNLSSNTGTSINQLMDILNEQQMIREVEYVKSRSVKQERCVLNNRKIKKELDWVPLYTLHEGIQKTYQWYKDKKHTTQKEKGMRLFNSPIAKKYLPLAENVLLFLIVFLLTLGNVRILENVLLDYSILYILLIGVMFGMRQALIAVSLSTLLNIGMKLISGRELIALFFDMQFLSTFMVYLSIGLIIGYLTDSRRLMKEHLQAQLEEVQQKHDFLYEVYLDTNEIKEKLQEQIIRNRDGIGRVYSVIRQLEHQDPSNVICTSISVLEDIIGSGYFTIYHVTERKDLYKLIHSKGYNNKSLSSITQSGELYKATSNHEVFVNRNLDPDLPAMSAPIIYKSKIVGLITIDDLSFESYSIYYENLFKVCTDIIGRAWANAMTFTELTKESRYLHGTTILVEDVMLKIFRSMQHAKERALLSYTIIKIEPQGMAYSVIEQLILPYLRSIDYIGAMGDSLIVFIWSSDKETVTNVQAQIDSYGLASHEVDDIELEEWEEKLIYA